MRQASNLPPGMRERDIPGNSLRDEIWQQFIEDDLEPIKFALHDWLKEHYDESQKAQDMLQIYKNNFGEWRP